MAGDDEPSARAILPTAAVTHPLRLAPILTYVPAFPLSIAHGVLSKQVVPAIGLLPLAFSFASSIIVLRVRPVAEAEHEEQQQQQQQQDEEAANEPREFTPKQRFRAAITHPLTIFGFDVLLATALMIVLVFTWISHTSNASLSMLAAYTTIPLLINFFVHLYLVGVALYEGLAVHGLVQWTAWRALPPDCPGCNVRLRPALPELPWLKYIQQRRRQRSAAAAAAAADSDYAPVLANDEEPYRDEEPYHDDVLESGGPNSGATEQPEAVEVRRKDRKAKVATPAPSGESTPWDT